MLELQREVQAKAQADRTSSSQDTSEGTGRVHYMLGSQPEGVDLLNERDVSGKFKTLDTTVIARNSLGYTGGSFDLINDNHVDIRVRKLVNTLKRFNGKPFYDAEENAIGSLDEAYWFLIPAGFDLKICPLKDIGMGLKVFDVDVVSCAAIYHLAKKQCPDLTDENKIKWAALRLEMYMAGWFDHQKMVKRVTLPDDFDKDILDDTETIDKVVKSAWKLCGFVPFVLEFCFRSYGVGYNDNSRNDFQMRAEKLATAANIEGVFDYLPTEILFGRAFRWIGVRRPRDALTAQKAIRKPAIPRIFFIRYRAAPAGQAIITTAYAVIQSLQNANWWDGIKNQAKYDDITLIACANEILENPCKYHILGFVYGQPLLTDVEERRVETAKAIASQMSPVLQAYCDIIMKQSDLGRQKVLKKPSDGNKALYAKSRELFLYARKHKVTNVAELFLESIVDPIFSTAHIERAARLGAGPSRKRTRSEVARGAAEELED